MMLALFILSGCGSGEKETANDNEDVSKEDNEEVDDEEVQEDEPEEEAESEETNRAATGDFAELITYMEDKTEGTANVLYENKESQVHELDGVTVSLDAYTLVELNDFHTNFDIPFNDETDGGVIIAQYTVTNELDQDVYYMPTFYLSFTGADKAYNNYKELLPEEEQLPEKLSPSNDYTLKAGESVTGYYAYPFGKSHLQQALDVGTVAIDVPSLLKRKKETSVIRLERKANLNLA